MIIPALVNDFAGAFIFYLIDKMIKLIKDFCRGSYSLITGDRRFYNREKLDRKEIITGMIFFLFGLLGFFWTLWR